MADELSQFIDSNHFDSKTKRVAKRQSCPSPVLSSVRRRGRPTKQLSVDEGSDEGIGSSLDPFNDSIAQSVKLRKRSAPRFDSKYFMDSVVDRIESKVKKSRGNDAIIDLKNLDIIDKKGLIEKRVRKEFGYFAENTFEDLRQKSFRKKESQNNCPKTLPKVAPLLTPNPSQRKSNVNRQKPSTSQTSRALQLRNQSKGSLQATNRRVTDIVVASDEESEEESFVDDINDLDKLSIVSNESEELDENHPLIKHENRMLWTDKDYQLMCFKKILELLKKNIRFKEALKQLAKQTLNLEGLPTGPNVKPIIRFNHRGEPNFEFYFSVRDSPLDMTEILNIDPQIIHLSQTIYDCINYSKNSYKRLDYNRELKFH